jgi:NAD(P) transhydrogenase
MKYDYDVIVIGSGPGGEGAAMQAAKKALKVAVVERFDKVGGACTHFSTIPSKALRRAVYELSIFRRNPLFGECISQTHFSFESLLRRAFTVIDRQYQMRRSFYERNRVDIITGHAEFVDLHTLEITKSQGVKKTLTGGHFIIGVGSRPYHPEDIDFTSPALRDSSTILNLKQTPKSITIYGAGVVGCEYASFFRNLNIKVNLINTYDRLLNFLDDEISDALAYHLRSEGVIIRHNEKYTKVETLDDHSAVVHLESGKRIKSGIFLWANGRSGNSHDLGLDCLGIEPDNRGIIKVNEYYQTDLPHIYAVGDITGFPALASAAYDQGRFAARHLMEKEIDSQLVRFFPTGIYTSPEISCVGKTEAELTAQRIPYEVGQSLFKSLARAQIVGMETGMLKILFHRETLELLGIHCFGYQAAEIIHIGQAIMLQKTGVNKLTYFTNTTFNYPTMAEAYRVAALNGLNRLF